MNAAYQSLNWKPIQYFHFALSCFHHLNCQVKRIAFRKRKKSEHLNEASPKTNQSIPEEYCTKAWRSSVYSDNFAVHSRGMLKQRVRIQCRISESIESSIFEFDLSPIPIATIKFLSYSTNHSPKRTPAFIDCWLLESLSVTAPKASASCHRDTKAMAPQLFRALLHRRQLILQLFLDPLLHLVRFFLVC